MQWRKQFRNYLPFVFTNYKMQTEIICKAQCVVSADWKLIHTSESSSWNCVFALRCFAIFWCFSIMYTYFYVYINRLAMRFSFTKQSTWCKMWYIDIGTVLGFLTKYRWYNTTWHSKWTRKRVSIALSVFLFVWKTKSCGLSVCLVFVLTAKTFSLCMCVAR